MEAVIATCGLTGVSMVEYPLGWHFKRNANFPLESNLGSGLSANL